MSVATASSGACAACESATGAAAGCAAGCPACINVLDSFLSSCAGDFDALNYEILRTYTSRLNASGDCFDFFNLASRPYAAALCSDAFHHVVAYVQSAASAQVVVSNGLFTTPPSCLLARTATGLCPAECQADLDLLAGACHTGDLVAWGGNGLDQASLNNVGAPSGTTVTPAEAFRLFVSGIASVPVNMRNGMASTPLSLDLGACRNTSGIFPSWSPPPPTPPPPEPPLSPPAPPPPAPPSPPAGDGPQISVAPLALRVSPDAKLVLSANVSSLSGSPLTLVWNLTSAPAGARLNVTTAMGVAALPVTLTLPTPSLAQPTPARLLLLPGALAPGGTYIFMLSASDALGTASAAITVRVAARPSGGVLAASPATGAALSTRFTVATSGWSSNEDGAPALEFSFAYRMLGGGGAPVLLRGFDAAPAVTVLLPEGDITVFVAARNAYGAESDAAAAVETFVDVTPPDLADPLALLAGVSNAANAALESGNAAGAASLAGAMASLLTNPAANMSLADQQGARDSLLATLASATALPATAAGLMAGAAAMSLLVAGGVEGLSPAGLAASVNLLDAMASVPGGLLPPTAANSVAGALSSLASPAASPALLSKLGGVVSSLGVSMMASLSTPGESVSISSAAVSMLLSLNDASADSSLFTAPLSAPGSIASFAPLPLGALASAPAGVAVQTTFSSLAFDPFSGSSSGTGVTQLAFSSPDGGEIVVQGLAQPIIFSMPALQLAEGMQAVCRFWDTAALAYSSDGCTSMPNPAPPSSWLALEWRANFTLSTPASLAAAWSAAGPLLANCGETILDCGNETQRTRNVALDPENMFTTPPIGCGSATAGVMRVFSGTACGVYKSDNPAQCSWNAIEQSFSGPGCVIASATQCACTHLTRCAPCAPLHRMPSDRRALAASRASQHPRSPSPRRLTS
jgi:hypothetical protein